MFARSLRPLLVALSVSLLGCDDPPAPRSEASSAPPAEREAPTPSASAAPIPSASAATQAVSRAACPRDMELVAGAYCPVVQQVCLEKPRILGTDSFGPCHRYAPAQCLSKTREAMRFCMDRYEWPNAKGEKPRTLVSWPEAVELCASVGKRLCTEHEFNFACEGETMKAHVYGNDRDDTKCHFDRPYRERTFNYARWGPCMQDDACREAFEALDQRLPAGSMPDCVSDHGVYDLNGNANEWVHRTDQRPPRRSGLKGGWWGPVRNRCRPMTTFHLEGDYGYEAGFRCCRDADPASPDEDDPGGRFGAPARSE